MNICLKIVLEDELLVEIDKRGREMLDRQDFLLKINLEVSIGSGLEENISEVRALHHHCLGHGSLTLRWRFRL